MMWLPCFAGNVETDTDKRKNEQKRHQVNHRLQRLLIYCPQSNKGSDNAHHNNISSHISSLLATA